MFLRGKGYPEALATWTPGSVAVGSCLRLMQYISLWGQGGRGRAEVCRGSIAISQVEYRAVSSAALGLLACWSRDAARGRGSTDAGGAGVAPAGGAALGRSVEDGAGPFWIRDPG